MPVFDSFKSPNVRAAISLRMLLQPHLPLMDGETEAQRTQGTGPRSPDGQFQNGRLLGLLTFIFFEPYHSAS